MDQIRLKTCPQDTSEYPSDWFLSTTNVGHQHPIQAALYFSSPASKVA